jgi:ABC-type polysaccharide/polyol phosphate export permease
MGKARTPFRRSLAIQMRVIWALMLREIITRYGRHNIGFLWLFVEPMLFTLGVTALWTFAGMGHGSNLPITAFALTGYSTILLWRNMPARCVAAINANIALMYHRNVRVMDIFLSRLVLEAVGATMSFFLLAIFFILIGLMDPPEDSLALVESWLLTGFFGVSLALFLGALAEKSDIVEKLWHPAAYLIFPLSGAAFIVEAAPPAFRDIVLWIPMVHCTEMIREAYFGSKIIAHYSTSYLVTSSMILLILGLAAERHVSRELVLE